MTCYHAVHLQLFGAAQQLFKLDKAVAVNAGVGRPALLIGADEPRNHGFLKAVLEIIHIIGNVNFAANTARVLNVIKRAAGFFLLFADVVVVEQLEGNARAVAAAFFHQIGGNRAVHAAAHGD